MLRTGLAALATGRACMALALLTVLVPAAAQAKAGDADGTFGRRGTVTLKAAGADAVAGAVKALPGHKVLAGGSAAGKLVVLRLRRTGSLDSAFGEHGQVVPSLPGASLDGVRALATFRDGRIVAAATLQLASGGTQLALVRLLPNGEIDPSFGAGLGYVLTGPAGSTLGSMAMDRNGGIVVAGGHPAGAREVPLVLRLAPDGSPDGTFGAGGTVDGASLGLAGRATGVLVRPDGTVVFCVGAGPGRAGPSTLTVVRLLAGGAPDPSFSGTGVVALGLTPFSGAGAGAAAIRGGPAGTLLVAGTDVTATGSLRVVVARLKPNGAIDARFGHRGFARVSRAGRDLRLTAMTRDGQGRIVLTGAASPAAGLVVRLRESGRRDTAFGNGGLTYPQLGRPPGGDPIYTTLDGVDADGSQVLLAGAAAGPGPLTRSAGGTAYGGRFALTVSRLR
jgi:uncharacterized delta-60 repeat protein